MPLVIEIISIKCRIPLIALGLREEIIQLRTETNPPVDGDFHKETWHGIRSVGYFKPIFVLEVEPRVAGIDGKAPRDAGVIVYGTFRVGLI